MHKFFVDKIIGINEKLIRISGEDKRHMSGPLRMVPGESVEIGDSAGTRFVCKITGYEKDTALLEVISFSSGNSEPPMDIWIFQGLPKSDKMDTIVQKCTELGAVRIVPVMCSRSISRFRNEEDKKKKTARWSKIAREAAKQCGRDRIPEVGQPLSLDDAVSEAAKAELCFIPWESEDDLDIRRLLHDHKKKHGIPGSVAFIIGPEGGFSAEEIQKADLPKVTLGPRILRTETASAAVLSMIMYEYELDQGANTFNSP